jgi:hypothetical protein
VHSMEDHDLRDRTVRLCRRGIELMRGGYLDLPRDPPVSKLNGVVKMPLPSFRIPPCVGDTPSWFRIGRQWAAAGSQTMEV